MSGAFHPAYRLPLTAYCLLLTAYCLLISLPLILHHALEKADQLNFDLFDDIDSLAMGGMIDAVPPSDGKTPLIGCWPMPDTTTDIAIALLIPVHPLRCRRSRRRAERRSGAAVLRSAHRTR